MAWTDVANQRLGAQAPAVIASLNGINPNLDWSQAINETADWNQQQYPDGGWQDPSRGSSAMIAAQIGQKAANMPSLAQTPQAQAQLTSQWNSLAQQGMQQAEAIQKEQATHGSKGLFGDLGPLAQIAALIPGPQQPFLLAANAANAASQGNWISAGLNAFGAYSGGWDGFSGGGGSDLPLTDSWNYNPADYGSMGAAGDLPLTDSWNYNPADYTNMGGTADLPLVDDWNYNPSDYSKIGSALTGTAGKAAATTALSRVLNGTATTEDYLSLGLKALPGVIGAIGSNSQANSLKSLADQYSGYGAPSRSRYEASFQPGFTMENDPGYKDALDQSSKATLHALSVNGNPAGSPNAWAASLADNNAKFAYPALQNYRSQALTASGIPQYNAAAPGLATGQLQSNAGVYNGIGSAIGSVVNPPQTLADILKQYQESNGGSSIFKVAA